MRKKSCLVAAAMNNGIFALARIKIAPYGNLVGNCRDMMPGHGCRKEPRRRKQVEKKWPETAAEGQSSDSFSANCLSPMRQNCGKTKTARPLTPLSDRHTAH